MPRKLLVPSQEHLRCSATVTQRTTLLATSRTVTQNSWVIKIIVFLSILKGLLYIEKKIKDFMKFYRDNFPKASILPKMHILEDHVVPWMRRWRMGSGIMGEQGAESIHAHLMRLERTYQGILNEVDRLLYIFQEQALESDPSLTNLRPSPKKRKEESQTDSDEN